MKTNHEQNINRNLLNRQRRREKGNALIYVLVAIVLFAALSFTLMRQTDTGEMSGLSDDKAELLATQLISYASQAKSAVDQMQFQGARIDNLDFTLPGGPGYEASGNFNMVFHPDGGGLINTPLTAQAIHETSTSPPAGWYMGRFNSVGWTRSPADDVILTAYQIRPEVCRFINRKITGNTTIPVLSGTVSDFLLDTATDTDLTSLVCPGCGEYFSLCVSNAGGTIYSFYSIIADQ